MPLTAILIIVAAFIAAASAVLAVAVVLNGRLAAEEQLRRRMGSDPADWADIPSEILARDATAWVDRRFYLLLASSGTALSGSAALAIVAGMGAVGCALPLVIWESLPAGLAGAVVGVALPVLWWKIQSALRLRAMENLLPGALDLLADVLRGGQTLEQAVEMVAQQTPSPLKEEFKYCVALLKMGQSPVPVMERLSRRIPLPEFQLFATAVLVHRQTGGNLASLTARLAHAARDRQEFQRHLGGQTVAARYSAVGMVICGVIGCLVLSSSRPEYLEFFVKHPSGMGLLLIAGLLLLVGIVWISRVLKVSY